MSASSNLLHLRSLVGKRIESFDVTSDVAAGYDTLVLWSMHVEGGGVLHFVGDHHIGLSEVYIADKSMASPHDKLLVVKKA